MTKAELMEVLKNLPDDTEIHISSDDEYINLKEDCMHIFHPLMEFDPKSIK